MTSENLAAVVRELQIAHQARLGQQLADAAEKQLTVAFDKAAAYTTVIVFGGYAGYFAIWQLTKDYLSAAQALSSALLILISLATFVLFEVFKMVTIARRVFGGAALVHDAVLKQDPKLLQERLDSMSTSEMMGLGVMKAVWATTVIVCVCTALAGAGVMSFAFVTTLASKL